MEIIRIIFIFILVINISLCAKRFYNLTENDFIELSKETKNTKIKWLMIFYTNEYHDYDKFMDLIKEDVYSHYKKNKNIKFGFLEINTKNVKWLIHLLDIKSVPNLVLIANEKMYYYQEESLSQENIINFIDEKKSDEDAHPIPEKITLIAKGKIMYNFLMNDLNEFFQGLLDRYNLDFKWNNKLSVLMIGIIMFLFFIIETIFIKSLCFRTNEDEKDEGDKIKEKNEIKKEKAE